MSITPTDDPIIQAAIEEIENKTWGVTEQFLAVHEVVYTDGKPQAVRIDREKEEDNAIVYFAIKDQNFYLVMRIRTNPEIELNGVWTEAWHSICLLAYSKELSYDELCAMSNFKSTGGWSKGDKKGRSSITHKSSLIRIEPNMEPDEFEVKLEKLPALLEGDIEGTLRLVEKANGYIQTASGFHNGNTSIGGLRIKKDLIKRMAALNLEIDFDLYAQGKLFLD